MAQNIIEVLQNKCNFLNFVLKSKPLVLQALKNLASKGKVVVCTVHQPSSQVFAMFDHVLLMAEGRTAFMGPTNKAIDFFASQVFKFIHHCVEDSNVNIVSVTGHAVPTEP